jgi:GAF domain-containing protein
MQDSQTNVDREGMRIAALYSLTLFCDDKHHVFDRFVHLAADIFGVPMATVSFIDVDRQIYFAKAGIEASGTPRSESICTYTVAENRTIVIPDTHADTRWRDRSFVIGHPAIRFYAGVPLHFAGQPIGTLCLLDAKPWHSFDQNDQTLLESLAFIVADLLEVQHLRESSNTGGLAMRNLFESLPAA